MNHMKSRIKSARGIMSPFPIMASNIDEADKPLMFSGFRKFVHICETGIHMKRSVAVHPDIAPTNLTPFSESFPVLAIITATKAMKQAIDPGKMLCGT